MAEFASIMSQTIIKLKIKCFYNKSVQKKVLKFTLEKLKWFVVERVLMGLWVQRLRDKIINLRQK